MSNHIWFMARNSERLFKTKTTMTLFWVYQQLIGRKANTSHTKTGLSPIQTTLLQISVATSQDSKTQHNTSFTLVEKKAFQTKTFVANSAVKQNTLFALNLKRHVHPEEQSYIKKRITNPWSQSILGKKGKKIKHLEIASFCWKM